MRTGKFLCPHMEREGEHHENEVNHGPSRAGGGGSLAPAASADILVSNLGASSAFTAASSTTSQSLRFIMASKFMTGPGESVVESVTAKLGNGNGYGLATYEAYIYADDGVSPGSVIATFDTMPSIPDGGGIANVTFESTLGIELDPNTTYWLGITNLTGQYMGWRATGSNAETSTAGWTIDDDAASLRIVEGAAGPWQDFSGNYQGNVFQYSINGTAVPVPGTLALLGAGGIVAVRRRRA